MLLVIEAVMFLVCAMVSLAYGDSALGPMFISAGVTAVAGLLLSFLIRGTTRNLSRRDGYVVVSLSWVALTAFGTLPFLVGGYVSSLTDAFFETMSGFTSTGATVINHIDTLPHGLLFWRSLMQWVGGLGIILFTIAVLPIFGVNGLQVFAAESGATKRDKIHPRIGVAARYLLSMYVGLTVALALLLRVGGMDLFDSICHSFCTLSTGGFSTHQDSIAYFNSPFIEYVISMFMFIGGINFTLLLMLTRRRFVRVWHDAELRWYVGSVLIFTFALCCVLYRTEPYGLETSFRKSLFQVISLHTSTGFAVDDYMLWVPFTWGLMLVLMVSGACSGSTSGGLKCVRLVILSRVVRNELKRILHPNAVLPVRIGQRQVVAPQTVSTVLAFCAVYCALVVFGILFMLCMGMGFDEAIGCSVSCLGNMGPGLGEVGPAASWSDIPAACKWLCSVYMLLGRLELFTLLLMLTPGFWRK